MWLIKYGFVALLATGAVQASGAPSEPIARVRFVDLALENAADRAELRRRVADAAHAFCRIHGDDVTPYALRRDSLSCLDRLRDSVVREMPQDVYRAYKRALREADVRGKGL